MPHIPEPATTVQDELAAMRKIAAALDNLDDTARTRTVRWVLDRYDPFDDEPGQQEV